MGVRGLPFVLPFGGSLLAVDRSGESSYGATLFPLSDWCAAYSDGDSDHDPVEHEVAPENCCWSSYGTFFLVHFWFSYWFLVWSHFACTLPWSCFQTMFCATGVCHVDVFHGSSSQPVHPYTPQFGFCHPAILVLVAVAFIRGPVQELEECTIATAHLTTSQDSEPKFA